MNPRRFYKTITKRIYHQCYQTFVLSFSSKCYKTRFHRSHFIHTSEGSLNGSCYLEKGHIEGGKNNFMVRVLKYQYDFNVDTLRSISDNKGEH